MATQYKNLINGEMIDTGEWCDVVNPATEEVIGQVPSCGAAELDQAVAAARTAFKTWSKTPIEERRATIQAVAKVIQDNHEELYRLLTAEQGKSLAEARGEVDDAGHQRAAATVDHSHIVGLNDSQGFAGYRLDQVVLYQDMHVLQELFIFSVEDVDVADQCELRLRRFCCLRHACVTQNGSH